MAYRTEQAYVGWVKRFILFHNKPRLPLSLLPACVVPSPTTPCLFVSRRSWGLEHPPHQRPNARTWRTWLAGPALCIGQKTSRYLTDRCWRPHACSARHVEKAKSTETNGNRLAFRFLLYPVTVGVASHAGKIDISPHLQRHHELEQPDEFPRTDTLFSTGWGRGSAAGR
ncbi:MAG: hypothetical protein KDA76_03165 [Planctomycetaceae bacterium]|nr:hypothetical protein [Planctomycetaceae bacterium]